MFFDEEQIEKKPKTEKERALELQDVLMNAIKMQALYSDGKLKIVETSKLIN